VSWLNALYRGLGWTGTSLGIPALVLRSRPTELAERMGRISVRTPGAVWLHAASVGELAAARSLLETMRTRAPGPVALTVMTRTGRERAMQLHPDIGPFHAPLDTPRPVRRAVDAIAPSAWISLETELWPALSHELARRGIPMAVVSARLSERSLDRMRRVRSLYAPALRALRAIGTRTEEDANRWIELGVPAAAVRCTGDLKDDRDVPDRVPPPEDRPAWIAACTRPGEEEEVLAALELMEIRIPAGELILAPRHPERFEEVAEIVARTGRPVRRWHDRDRPAGDGWSVLVVDEMGVLDDAYRRARAAFVGGSLVPVGGHSPWEAAVAGRPVAMGPDVTNCADAFSRLRSAGAAVQVGDAAALADRMVTWLTDDAAAEAAGRHAHQVIRDAAGAAVRTVDFLRERGVLS
jgi:3-deoxy-D-manno-octulosonic-acid transferase